MAIKLKKQKPKGWTGFGVQPSSLPPCFVSPNSSSFSDYNPFKPWQVKCQHKWPCLTPNRFSMVHKKQPDFCTRFVSDPHRAKDGLWHRWRRSQRDTRWVAVLRDPCDQLTRCVQSKDWSHICEFCSKCVPSVATNADTDTEFVHSDSCHKLWPQSEIKQTNIWLSLATWWFFKVILIASSLKSKKRHVTYLEDQRVRGLPHILRIFWMLWSISPVSTSTVTNRALSLVENFSGVPVSCTIFFVDLLFFGVHNIDIEYVYSPFHWIFVLVKA